MCSARSNAALPALGFPIRASTDHRLFSAYPWLIAAVHALHRLKVPRHPPYALTILTVKLAFSTFDHERAYRSARDLDVTAVQFSRTAEEAVPQDLRDGPSKLNNMRAGRVLERTVVAAIRDG